MVTLEEGMKGCPGKRKEECWKKENVMELRITANNNNNKTPQKQNKKKPNPQKTPKQNKKHP